MIVVIFMNFYLVGIKGTGMSALALYLKEAGHEVIGSDVDDYYFTEDNLITHDIKICVYNKGNIINDYIYIIGLSINRHNPEFKEILDRELEFYYYNNFINEFIDKKIIAVSGTHGKTSTTHLIKELSDVSAIVGCGDGRYTDSNYLVLEACEYKNHFHSYEPELLLVQNIDLDHIDYFKTKKELFNSYQIMASKSKKVLINGDESILNKISHSNKYTYGFNNNNDYVIKLIRTDESGYTFLLKGKGLCRLLKCNLLGIHNLLNYVSAYLACIICELEIKQLKKIELPNRRMTQYAYGENILIDDYAHHPKEISCLYETIKLMYPLYKINVIFQSHTYSRTYYFRRQFKKVLSKFDNVYLLDVFSSAREKNNVKLQKKINKYFKKFNKYEENILSGIDGNDKVVWIFLGAGSTDKILRLLKNNKNTLMKI